MSMTLALKLKAAGKDTDYAPFWDKPRCEADYPARNRVSSTKAIPLSRPPCWALYGII